MQQKNANQRHSDRRSEFCCCVKNRGCKTSLLRRKPVADRLGIGRKSGRFTDAQKKSCGKETADSTRERCCKRSCAPKNRTYASHNAYSKTVQQEARMQLQQSVTPTVSTQQITERNGGYSKRATERILRDRQVDPIEVINQHSETQQQSNSPPSTGHMAASWRIKALLKRDLKSSIQSLLRNSWWVLLNPTLGFPMVLHHFQFSEDGRRGQRETFCRGHLRSDETEFCVTAQHHDHNHLAAAPLAHVTSRRRSGHRFALSQSRAPTPRRFPLLTKREKGSLPR